MVDHKLPTRAMSGELEDVGRRERRGNRRTALLRIVCYLASRWTGALPHLTPGFATAQYAKGAVGLWPRE